MPAVARNIQWDQADYGEEYLELGARQLMMLGRHRDRRRMLVEALADRIVDVAQAHALPELPLPFDFTMLTSAFQAGAAANSTNGDEGEGPRYVQFLFVAGKRDELMPLRQQVSGYGDQGEEWRPYHPDVEMAVRDVALEVAYTERLWPEAVPLGPDLIARLTSAERSNKLVAIIVDTWTLRLEQYHEFMREYDRHNFLNCVVLIPWNEADPETMGARTMLQQVMHAAFVRRVQVRDPHTFIDTISTAPDLRRGLAKALAVARARVIYAAEVRRRVDQDQVISRPVIGVRTAGG
jgi:FxsC-like protein